MAVRVSPGQPRPAEEHALRDAVRARLADELRDVRSVAANWRAALAAMLALVATVSVVRGRDSIAGIGRVPQILVGAFLLGAVVAAALGAFLSSRSAFGLPKEEDVPASLTELITLERARVRRAVRDLRAAIVLTFVTLALIVASVGVAWYA